MTEDKRRSWLTGLLVRLVKEKPLGAVGLVITLLLLVTGIFADYLAPYGMNEMHTDDRLAPPSTRFLLGTDNLGRDLLSRVIFGARVSMVVGVASSAVATVISVAIGMMSGYIGGKFDLIVQRFVDAVMSLPMIIIVAVDHIDGGPGHTAADHRHGSGRRHQRLASLARLHHQRGRQRLRAGGGRDRRSHQPHPAAPHPAQHRTAHHRGILGAISINGLPACTSAR